MIQEAEHFISKLAQEYKQLYLPIRKGISDTSEYKDVTLKGHAPLNHDLDFILHDKDLYQVFNTDYGYVKYIYLYNRSDFEKLVKKLAYKCEPVELPRTMGSIVIRGVTNWEKIKLHKLKYELMGNNDWNLEFKRFTAVKKNYQDTIIIISDGYYSNLPLNYTNFTERQWNDISVDIRKYHELTHFICMNKYPKLKHPIFDELLADCMGLLFAAGYYDKELAGKCIGVTKKGYKEGSRLENYVDRKLISCEVCMKILLLIDSLEAILIEKMDRTQMSIEEFYISYLEYLIDSVYGQENILLQLSFIDQLSQQ